MPDTVDSREEQQLLDAVKTATDLVAKGKTPDEAIEKVARDSGFGPGKIRLIGQAYNNGQQLAQWRQPAGTSILDKVASFELCDPQKVIDNIYHAPAEKKAAERVHKDYLLPPTWANNGQEKKASTPLPRLAPVEPYKPDPNEALHHAYGRIDRAKIAADEARRQANAATDDVMRKVAGLVGYFKQASHGRLPFEVVESAAREYYGDPGASLMNVVYARLGRTGEKRAGDKPPILKTPLNQRAEPFTLIKAAIDAAGRAGTLKKHATDLTTAAEKMKVEELRPFSNAGSTAVQPAATGPWTKEAAAIFGTEKQGFGFMTEVAAIAAGDIAAHKATHKSEVDEDPYGDVAGIESEVNAVRQQAAAAARKKGMKKQAFLGAGIGTAIGSSLGRQVGTVGQTTGDLVDDQWMKLEDPEHENELRKIKAHAMINQLLTDPEDPISGHDPDKVLAAYNEIAQATPRVAENIATLRPQLRKQLEGHREPFEAKEMLDIEHGLAKSKMPTPNTSILGDTPEKILG